MTGSIDPITALERSWDELAKVIANLDDAALRAPCADCPAWDVRGVLNHVLGAALMFNGANDGVELPEDAGDAIGSDSAASAVAAIGAANVASWARPGGLEGERVYPFGSYPAPMGLVINVGEVALHAWDIAKATGQPARIDADVAQLVLDFYQHAPMDDLRAHGVYGPEIPVDASAPVADRLLGFMSRQP